MWVGYAIDGERCCWMWRRKEIKSQVMLNNLESSPDDDGKTRY